MKNMVPPLIRFVSHFQIFDGLRQGWQLYVLYLLWYVHVFDRRDSARWGSAETSLKKYSCYKILFRLTFLFFLCLAILHASLIIVFLIFYGLVHLHFALSNNKYCFLRNYILRKQIRNNIIKTGFRKITREADKR